MSAWQGINAAVRGGMAGFNFGQEAQARREDLRKQREQRQEDAIVDLVGQSMANGQPVGGEAPAAPATTVATPQQPTALAGAPAQPAADPDEQAYQVQEQDVQAYQRMLVSGRAAMGGPALNHDVLQDTVTGRGMMAPNTAVAAMRAASGNQNGPLTRTDYAAWVDAVTNRLMKEGLGHRVPEFRGRMMQTLHSAAARTMAVASAMADSGDLEGAARTMATAYGMMPDGQTLQFQRGEQGLVATRVNAQGQPVGEPFTVTPETIRETALRAQDPVEFAKLLLEKGKLTEITRHNQATEALQSRALDLRGQAMAMRGAGGRSGGGGGGGDRPIGVGDQIRLDEHMNPLIQDGLAAAKKSAPSGTQFLPDGVGNAVAHDLASRGLLPPRAAAEAGAAVVSRQAQVARGPQGLEIIFQGSRIPLGPQASNLLNSLAAAPPAPGPSQHPAAPGVVRKQAPPPALVPAPRG